MSNMPPNHPTGYNPPKRGYYRMQAVCENCRSVQEFEVPQGLPAKEYINNNNDGCDYCKWKIFREVRKA